MVSSIEVQIDFRKATGKFRDAGCDPVGHDGGDHADAKCSPDALLQMRKGRPGLGDLLQDKSRRFAQGFAECGQTHRSAEPFEERVAKLSFEAPDLLR